MIPPQRLLVATDFSAGADRAADVAIGLAATWGARIEWIHACPEAPHALTPSSDRLVAEYVDHARREARTGLDALEARARERNVESATHLTSGRPDLAVATCAEETGSDWVVVGTHGRTGIQSLWFGSVAEKIVRASPTSVLCVRSGATPGAGGVVVYGEDFGAPDNRRAAARVARSLDAHVVAIHAIEMVVDVMANVGFSPSPTLLESSAGEARTRLAELSSEYGEGADVGVRFGSASVALCDEARRRNACLIVAGTASRKGLERWMLGSVAEKTIRNAPCSVLILK